MEKRKKQIRKFRFIANKLMKMLYWKNVETKVYSLTEHLQQLLKADYISSHYYDHEDREVRSEIYKKRV